MGKQPTDGKTLVELTQNWLFISDTWTQCPNYMEPYLKMDGVLGYEDAFKRAGYQKQIEVKRGTWTMIEGLFALWVNTHNETLPIYAITIEGGSGQIGTVYINTMPDMLAALEHFRGMLSLFDSMSVKMGSANESK